MMGLSESEDSAKDARLIEELRQKIARLEGREREAWAEDGLEEWNQLPRAEHKLPPGLADRLRMIAQVTFVGTQFEVANALRHAATTAARLLDEKGIT